MQVKKQQLTPDMEHGLVPNRERSTSRLHIDTLFVYLMHSISCGMPDWMKHKLESRLPGRNINNQRYAEDTTFMPESEEELKGLLMKVKEESKNLA